MKVGEVGGGRIFNSESGGRKDFGDYGGGFWRLCWIFPLVFCGGFLYLL